MNKKQWNMIVDFLKTLILNLDRKLKETQLEVCKSKKLNLTLFSEINKLDKKLKNLKYSKKIDFGISGNSGLLK